MFERCAHCVLIMCTYKPRRTQSHTSSNCVHQYCGRCRRVAAVTSLRRYSTSSSRAGAATATTAMMTTTTSVCATSLQVATALCSRIKTASRPTHTHAKRNCTNTPRHDVETVGLSRSRSGCYTLALVCAPARKTPPKPGAPNVCSHTASHYCPTPTSLSLSRHSIDTRRI